MRSKWYESREKAVSLRKAGLSIKKIEHMLGIPRSTLSGWFKDIELSESQKKQLRQDWLNGLANAQRKAAMWHNTQKQRRISLAREKAMHTLSLIDPTDPILLELALAILYLGEGSKKTLGTSLGSSDPLILQFFIAAIRTIYRIDISVIKAELHLRADQNATALKKYWSRELGLPLQNFKYVSNDRRTRGSKTYPTYKGVCHIRCSNTDVQRRLIFLSRLFCSKVAQEHLGS